MSALQEVDGVKDKKDATSVKEGYLYKQGGDITGNWKKRYFVLTSTEFKYYKVSPACLEPLAVI